MTDDPTHDDWNARAAAAERAVIERYVGGIPGVSWARSAWPAVPLFGRAEGRARWHYWWSAHLVEAAVDAARHRPTGARRRRARAFARGIRVRNGGTLSRTFYDDLAWLGLAYERGAEVVGQRRATERIAARLEAAIDPDVGAVPWQVGSRFFNAPANGPAAILFARTGRREAGRRLSDWMDAELRDPVNGLIVDGVDLDETHPRRATELYTYCQGVALGAAVDLARSADGARFAARAATLIAAITAWTGPALVLPGAGGGDRGLFAAIACRYLAEAARVFDERADAAGPDAGDADRAAASARSLVLANAEAVWNGRATVDGLPLFAADWRARADPAPAAPERDLSVQLGGWLALESAVAVTARPRA
ncbi:glycoside hydrolase family 76 protein [Microbacterium sp. P07]|uniref:glycoside hydrolase family 76 protein n=1 Tax=Microbacterium sp. P07 TaxID=3366952 RepID=UPI0037456E2C